MFCIYTTSFFIAKMWANNKRGNTSMEDKYIKILLSISRINSLLKNLTSELDKVYLNLTDDELLFMLDLEKISNLSIEDYE